MIVVEFQDIGDNKIAARNLGPEPDWLKNFKYDVSDIRESKVNNRCLRRTNQLKTLLDADFMDGFVCSVLQEFDSNDECVFQKEKAQ